MELKCKFSAQEWTFGDGARQMYTCIIKEASITKRGTEIAAFIGNHIQGRSNHDVTAITFYDTTVHYFPRGLHKIFPNLKSLQISDCGLKEISRADLFGLENIEDLSLWNNQLRLLPSDLFFGMNNLKQVDFDGNDLEFLSSKLLKPVAKNLQYLDFENNSRIDAFFAPGSESNIESMQELMDIIDEKCERPIEDEEKEEFDRNFSEGFRNLWLSGHYSDLIIIGGSSQPREFKVHKNVLAMQSRVMAKNFPVDGDIMKIADFSANAVEGLLEFLYTGEIKDKRIITEIYAIAAKYDVKLLKKKAGKIVLSNVDESNALEVFSLGHLHNSDEMKRAAFEVIKKIVPDEEFDESLMKNPEDLKEIVEDARKIKQAQNEFRQKLKRFKAE